tara:strand:- start:23 stop:412 length:390 start_codon:yes stop_codon:yes gene_type:complete
MKKREHGDFDPFCSPCEEFVEIIWDGSDVGEDKIMYKSGASRNSIGKTRLDLIPPEALEELGEVFGEGAISHGDDNWKKGMPNSVVINHMMKHFLAWQRGDRNELHLGKVMFGCCVLIWNEANNVNVEE